MKTQLRGAAKQSSITCIRLAAAIAVVGFFCAQASAVPNLIAAWNFESGTGSPPAAVGTDITGLGASTGTGTASGHHASSSTYDNPVGNGTAESLSSNTWDIGDYYQFQVATTGLDDIGMSFSSTSSNTGARDFKLRYSTDGSNFTDANVAYANFPNAGTDPGAWSSNINFYHPKYDKYVDLTSITALDNQATLFLRVENTSLVSANGGAIAGTGTSRIDNIQIFSDYEPNVYTDYSQNGTSDAADYVLWGKGRTVAGPHPGGPVLPNEMPDSSTGGTDEFDWVNWKEGFGNTYLTGAPGAGGGGGLGVGAVPEPTSVVLLVVGFAGVCLRRRRA